MRSSLFGTRSGRTGGKRHAVRSRRGKHQLTFEPLENRQMLSAAPMTLEPLGVYSDGTFDESAAEIVTHDPDIAAQAQRIIYIRDGEIEREERKEQPV